MAKSSYVITVLFNTKDRTFLGRGGRWQKPEEFLGNPPSEGKDVAVESRAPEEGSSKTDPGGYWMCVDGSLYWFNFNPATGGFERYNCGPCPW
jgi:hypothetical protein